MNQLARIDTTTLNRALVGFDRIFDDFHNRFANQINNNYPPYNVLKRDEDNYEIQIAVSGFEADEINVEISQEQLVIKGEHAEANTSDIEYMHRGLATRDFTRSFTLAEHIVVGDCKVKNGILTIALKRIVPEALKPRQIKVQAE